MEQLLTLDGCKEKKDFHTSAMRSWIGPIATPIKVSFWQSHLANHSDKRLAGWLIQGFTEGFRIRYPRQGICPLKIPEEICCQQDPTKSLCLRTSSQSYRKGELHAADPEHG